MTSQAWSSARIGFLLLAFGGLPPRAQAESAAESMQSDAQLSEVTFINAKHGWAVGDRGVIWHTSDGGQHWQLQNSEVDCRLSSVHFFDEKIGWAAGGYTQPYTQTTTGVVLRTRDGGEHWTVDRKQGLLPAIARIRFFDTAHGWAIGQSSAAYPAGVYSSDDGGRSWAALPSTQSQGWLAGDLIDPHTGALAGRTSTLAVIRRRGVETKPADFGLRALRQMRLIAPSTGWLVGDGGLVLFTRDLGASWQTPPAEVPDTVRNHFDLSALAVRGDHVWAAGTPGTRVVRSVDGGRTWNAFDTGQSLPIQSLTFVDDRRGWAVGDLGTILATADGGQTWRVQRGGGKRSAFLGLYNSAHDLPLELIARLSADEGYLGAVELLNRRDVEPSGATSDAALRAHEASVRVGGSAADTTWRFPLRQSSLKLSAEQLVEDWNRASDGHALEKLEAHVVSRIRMWRPNVVFTAASDPRGGDPLAHLTNQVVLRAVERAGDPKYASDQITEAGLQPWKVQKVYGTLPAGQTGTSNVNTAQIAARLGRSIAELAAPARGVIASAYVAPSANLGFRLLVDHIPQEVGQRDFFSGIPLSPGGEARRRLDEVADNNLDAMRREAQLRRNLQAIIAQAESSEAGDGRFLADIGQQTRSMQPDRAADVLYQLAERYHHQGRWELAAECFDLIVERYPKHPLAGSSLVWLVQYYASSEAAWRTRAPQQFNVQQVTAQAPAIKRKRARADMGDAERADQVGARGRVEQAAGTVTDVRGSESRVARASGYAKQLEQLQPALFTEPMLRFPLGVAQRQQGLPRQAERYYQGLRHARPHDAWWECAQTELWLGEPKGQPPKSLANCVRAAGRPRLDGKLDEPMWRSGNAIELHSPQHDDAEWGAVAMLAYDEEFLYVGVSCTKAAGFEYVRNDQPRSRDADLAAQDRIELLVDVDRDFATYYRLVIDHRGWTGDSCWQDRSWDPQWYVAGGAGDGNWTAEAAIPIAELLGQPPASKHAWAVGVQRVVPGVGFQSWTTPAASEIAPEGFGYLIFE